jgi:hypothetical protein
MAWELEASREAIMLPDEYKEVLQNITIRPGHPTSIVEHDRQAHQKALF